MNLYDWMVKYTPQTEWIEHKGMLVWITEVLTALGAGSYLVALYFNNLVGVFVAWLIIVAIDIPLHMADYGKPLRFWRTIAPFSKAWKTSWFSRGVTFTVLYSGFGFLPVLFMWAPSATILNGWFGVSTFGVLDIVFRILAGITGFLVLIYSGFIMSYCRSIPFWNSALLPVLSAITGLTDGLFIMMAILLAGDKTAVAPVATISFIFLIASALIITVFLWTQTYTSQVARHSVAETIKGSIAPAFWIGVVVFGIAIPLGVTAFHYFAGELNTQLLVIAIISRVIGAVSLKFSLLKGGMYEPLIPSQSSAISSPLR